MRSFWGSTKPPAGTPVDFSHPWCRKLRLLLPCSEGAGAPVEVVRARPATLSGAPSWGGSASGTALLAKATADTWALCEMKQTVLPTTQATVLVIRQKLDTTLRASTLFGISETGGPGGIRLGAHVPYSDGTVYFDFGTSTGANRLTVAGLTFTTAEERWAFVAGTRGSAIYRNGVLLASQATVITRSNSSVLEQTFGLNAGQTAAGDLQRFTFFALLEDEWTVQQVKDWSATPYAMFQAPVWARLFVPVVVPQTARPASDITPNAWHDQAAGTTNLYATLNEVTANDATYIEGPAASATPSEQKVRLAALTDPSLNTGHVLRYRYEKDLAAGDSVNLTVTLYAADGTTVIASQQHTGITDTVTAGTLTLSGAEADAIPSADYATGLVVGFKEQT